MEQEILKLILSELREMKEDFSTLKNDMAEIKERLTKVEERLTNLENRVINLENRVTNVEELGEFNKENIESIKNVVTNHYMEFKKFVKSNNTQHNLYNAKLLQYNKEN